MNSDKRETKEKEFSGRPLKPLEAEVENLRRRVRRLERDNRMLAIMNQNAEQLRRSYETEKKLQYLYNDLLLENCPNMIFLFNQQLRFVICSNACLPLLSEDNQTELVNQPFAKVFAPSLKEQWVQKILLQNQEALKQLITSQYDDTIVFADDSFIHVQITVSPIVDENHVCMGTVMTINDITDLFQAKQRVEEAARSKSSFLANMSHEIRTPMNAVKGLSELLALTDLNFQQRSYVNNIISASNSLLGIINDVLDFSKIDANKIEFIEGPYQLSELLVGVCNIVNMRADEKGLPLLIEAAPDLPVSMYGDDVRLKQIMINLLTNGVKYTKEGYVKLILRMEEAEDQTWLVCDVKDSGIGIRQEDLPGLFDAFSRVDLHTNRNITGTGLGLAISKQLVRGMGGEIWVASEYGKGSTFSFRVPQKVVDPQPFAQVEKAADKKVLLLMDGIRRDNLMVMLSQLGVAYGTDLEAVGSYTHCIFDKSIMEDQLRTLHQRLPNLRYGELKNMSKAMQMSDFSDTILYRPLIVTRLAKFLNDDREYTGAVIVSHDVDELVVKDVLALVVDDNEINLIVSSEMLSSFEVEVICAESGEEALVLCQEQKYDIIFMDHMMPGMDGVTTTKAIRNGAGWNQKTPIVALTANVVNNMKNYYLNNGMDDFVGKPVELEDLARILVKWLPSKKLWLRNGSAQVKEDMAPENDQISPQELIHDMDYFGFYASDVIRELNGDFEAYIGRMKDAYGRLDQLVNSLKKSMQEEAWQEFAQGFTELRSILYGIGARDCAARARKLGIAAHDRNKLYIDEDFASLMDNIYMLTKKLAAIIPLGQGQSRKKYPLNTPEFLYGCLEQMRTAIENRDELEVIKQLDNAVSFSLNKELDQALVRICQSVNAGKFAEALALHQKVLRQFATIFI